MIVFAFVLGIIAGGFLTYELISLFGKIRNRNVGDEHVE